MAKEKREILIHILGEDTPQVVEMDVIVFEDGVKCMIPQEELFRVCLEKGIPFPEFVTQDRFIDAAYDPKKKDQSLTPPFDKIIRHTCVYRITHNGRTAIGAGSAGADNVGSWNIKPYAYEMAHKRGQARCIKMALGIMDYLSDVEMSDITTLTPKKEEPQVVDESDTTIHQDDFSDITEDLLPDFAKTSTEDTAILPMQKGAMLNIIAKAAGKPGSPTLSIDDIKAGLLNMGASDIWKQIKDFDSMGVTNPDMFPTDVELPKQQFLNLFNSFSESQASEFIMGAGNIATDKDSKTSSAIELQPVQEPVSKPDPFGGSLDIFNKA